MICSDLRSLILLITTRFLELAKYTSSEVFTRFNVWKIQLWRAIEKTCDETFNLAEKVQFSVELKIDSVMVFGPCYELVLCDKIM